MVYIATFFLLSFFAFLELNYRLSKRCQLALFTISYLVITCQVALRWETGTDWIPYFEHFQQINNFENTSPLLTGMEYGYSLLVFSVKLFTHSYTSLLAVHAIIYYYLVFVATKQLSPYFFIALLLYYAFTMGVMGAQRQLIALGLVLYGCRYIIKPSFFKYLLCIAVASFFHTTAILGIVLYFTNKDINSAILLGIIFVAFILGKTSLPAKAFTMLSGVGGIGDKLMFYLEGGVDNAKEYSVSTMGLIKRMLFVTVFIVAKRRAIIKVPQYNILLNSYIIGIVFYFLFSSSLTVMVSRGSLYFNAFEPILITCMIALFSVKQDKVILLIILIILAITYFFQSIAQYPDLFIPYKGLFINSDYIRDLR